MKWIKNNTNAKLSFIEREEKLFGTKDDPEKIYHSECYEIKKMKDFINILKANILSGSFIYVFCDYDCDGVMSGAEWELIFRGLRHSNYKIRAPRRMSEGYGMSDKIVDEILTYPIGLVIMVDNGIAAIEQSKRLRDNGWQVMILDHHLASSDGVPNVDVLIDPEAIPDSADFTHYCGAGLTYKVAQYLSNLPETDEMHINETTRKKVLSFAAIATIADVVYLIDEEKKTYDNYLIVKEGLRTILQDDGRTIALYVLLRLTGLDTFVNEENFGYKIGPIINAIGRIRDDGANEAIQIMTFDEPNFSKAEELVKTLIDANNLRKEIQNTAVKKTIEEVGVPEYNIIIAKSDDVPEGVAGLVAGDLCKRFEMPSIMLVKTDSGILKGSARSTENVNIKKLLDDHADLIYQYGGHAVAAGIKVLPDKYDQLKSALESRVGLYAPKEEVLSYDYDIMPEQAEEVMKQLKCFAPYGPGNPKPVFRISIDIFKTKYSDGYEILGAEKKVIKLKNRYISAINFSGGKEKVMDIIDENGGEKPSRLQLIGTLSENTYYGRTSIQLMFEDVKVVA